MCVASQVAALLVLCGLADAPRAAAAVAFAFDYQGNYRVERALSEIARPEAVTIDAATGEVCVTEAVGSSLQVFNARGALLFASDANSQLATPASACIDAAGNFVCTDTDSLGTRTIRRLNFLGEPEAWRPRPPRARWSPLHLIVTRDGGYVTLDQGTGLLARHDPITGQVDWARELVGDRAQEIGLGRPCEGPDGRLFVPGGELHQVLVLSPEGELLSSFGDAGTGTGRLSAPVGIAPGPDGTFAVLDRMRAKVLLFDAQLRFAAEFGVMGDAPGNFYHPLAIACAPEQGLAVVTQGYEGRVQLFRLRRLDGGTAPAGAASGLHQGAAAPADLPPAKGAVSM